MQWTLLASLTLAALPSVAQDVPSPKSSAAVKGLLVNSEDAYAGYTLVAPLRSKVTYLLDMQGQVAHTWESDSTPGNAVYLLEDGSLLRTGRVENERFHGGGQGGRIQRFSWDGELLWDYQLSTDTRLLHHDIEPMPNGHVLAIAWELKDADEELKRGRSFEAIHEEGIWPDCVLELAPEPTEEDLGGAEIVWEWHAWDHLVQDVNPQAEDFGSIADSPGRIDVNAGQHQGQLSAEEQERQRVLEERMRALGYLGGKASSDDSNPGRPGAAGSLGDSPDWLHTNSIAYDPERDLILLSSRTLSEVWIIDHATTTEEARGEKGDLLWRFGNPSVAGQEGDRQLFGQHDARFVGSDGELKVQVFNNGDGRDFEDEPYSTVDVIDVELGAGGELVTRAGAQAGATHFFSSFISGAQPLPNGSLLVCSGAEARLLELSATGELVWEWRSDLPSGADGGRRPPGPPSGPPRARGGGPGPRHGGPRRAPGLFRATRYGADDPAVLRLLTTESEGD